MGIKLYNTANQRLNAFEMLMMNKFNTYDFAGLYKDAPANLLTFDTLGHFWKWNTGVLPSRMIGGGCMLYVDSDSEEHTFSSYNPTLWAYKVDLNIAKDISTENVEVELKEIQCDSISRTAYNQELPSEDTGLSDLDYIANASSEKDYQYTFTIDGIDYQYWCNTLWLNDHEFLIPICCGYESTDGYNMFGLITAKDKASLEDFLTRALFNQLMEYIKSNFVWHEAGSSQSSATSTFKKGQVGKLLIDGNQIKNVESLDSDDFNKNEIDIASNVLCISNLSDDDLQYDSRDILMLDTPVPSFDGEKPKARVHKLDTLDVSNGGTGGTTRESAKRGLGIYYGTELPTSSSPVSDPQNGDVYFLLSL